MKFTGICLITNNVPALMQFYAKVLGIEGSGNGVHAELKPEGGSIAIFSSNGMEKMAPGAMQGTGHGSFTIGFEVENLDTEYERLKALGVQFVRLPTAHPWGAKSFWFRDPDGNIVDFYTLHPR
jgi:uncharacterized glyoxalase superfamily protein PhnB